MSQGTRAIPSVTLAGLPQISAEKSTCPKSERLLQRASKRLLAVGLSALAAVLLYSHPPGSTFTSEPIANHRKLLAITHGAPQRLRSWGHATIESKVEDSEFKRHLLAGHRHFEAGRYAAALVEYTHSKDDAMTMEANATKAIMEAQQWRAQAYFRQGQLPAADHAMEVARSLGQNTSIESVSLLHNFAVLRRDMGDLRSAMSFVRKARVGVAALKNAQVRWTPSLLLAEAEVLQHYGDHSKAQDLGQQALEQHNKFRTESRRSQSELDYEAGAIYSLLGRVEYSIGDVTHAMQLLQKSKNFLSGLYQGHPDVIETQIAIALCKRDLADMEGGLQVLMDTESILRKSADEGPELGHILQHKAFFLDEMERSNSTKTIKEAIVHLIRKYGGLNHWRVALAFNTYGDILQHDGNIKRALSKYNSALEINLKVLGVKHRRTAGSYNNLGLLYDELGDLALAEQALTKSLQIHIAIMGHKGPNVGLMHNNIAMLRMRQGKDLEAYQLLQEGMAMLKESGIPEQSPHFIGLAKNLAAARKALAKKRVAQPAGQNEVIS